MTEKICEDYTAKFKTDSDQLLYNNMLQNNSLKKSCSSKTAKREVSGLSFQELVSNVSATKLALRFFFNLKFCNF